MATPLRTALTALTIVAGVAPVPAFAQTDRRPQLVLARSSSTAVGSYDVTLAAPSISTLPINLVVSSVYQPLVALMLRDSPTFRRQCARIAVASNLLVTIASEPPRSEVRPAALTHVSRYEGGRIRAEVRVPTTSRAPELIAHELEHVLEQLDGVDLRAKARLKSTGVRSCECGDNTAAFETVRAVSTGHRVARELGRDPRR